MVYGGQKLTIQYTQTAGAFTNGTTIEGTTSGAKAAILRNNGTSGVMRVLSIFGTFQVGENIFEGANTADADVLSAHADSRSEYIGDAPDTGYVAQSIQNYNTGGVAVWTPSTGVDKNLTFDMQTAPASVLPNFVAINNFSVADYDYAADTTTLTAVIVEKATAPGGPWTIVASLSMAASNPDFGPKVFGYPNLFIDLGGTVSTRYIRVVLRASGAGSPVTIGSVWIGNGINSVDDEGWNYEKNFRLIQMDRDRITERESGERSENPRTSLLRFVGNMGFNEKSWHIFKDGAVGRFTNEIDDKTNPWLICFDPGNKTHKSTGQHDLVRMFKRNGNPDFRDRGVHKDGLFFLPKGSLDYIEHV